MASSKIAKFHRDVTAKTGELRRELTAFLNQQQSADPQNIRQATAKIRLLAAIASWQGNYDLHNLANSVADSIENLASNESSIPSPTITVLVEELLTRTPTDCATPEHCLSPSYQNRKSLTVAIISSEGIVKQRLTKAFSDLDQGTVVSTFPNFAEFDAANQGNWGLILMDGLSGLDLTDPETIATLNRIPSRAKFCLIQPELEKNLINGIAQLDADGWVSYPFDIDDLVVQATKFLAPQPSWPTDALLICDDPLLEKLASATLKAAGIKVSVAKDPNDWLNLAPETMVVIDVIGKKFGTNREVLETLTRLDLTSCLVTIGSHNPDQLIRSLYRSYWRWLEIRQRNLKAQQTDEFQANFVKDLSHEIRTPLNGLLGATQLLEEKISDSNVQDLIDLQKQSSQSLLTAIDELVSQIAPTKSFDQLDTGDFPAGKNDLREINVLVAEDNPNNIKILQRYFERLNCQLTIGQDGEQAVELFKKRHFDIIFMDCQMPGIDGYEATRLIRALGGRAKDVPIVALTAFVYPEDIQTCLSAGMNDHLPKPVDLNQIRHTLERYFGDARLTDAFARKSPRNKPVELSENQLVDLRKVADLIELADGDYEFATSVVKEFEQLFHDMVQEMEKAASEPNFDHGAIAFVSHRLIGSCGNVGARQLVLLCRSIEKIARKGGTQTEIQQRIARLKEQYQPTIRLLNRLIKSPGKLAR